MAVETSIPATQDGLYEQATTEFGDAPGRLVRAYEAEPDRQSDLLQEYREAKLESVSFLIEMTSLRVSLSTRRMKS